MRVVAFAHVSNVLGSILDAKRAAEIAHQGRRQAAARRLPGGAAHAGRCRRDRLRFLRFLGAQALRPDRHRRAVGTQELLEAMPPWQGGGAMIDRVTFEKTTYLARPVAVRGGNAAHRRRGRAHAAIDWVNGIGLDAIHAHESALVAECRAALRTVPRRHPVRARGQRRNRQLRGRRGASARHRHHIGRCRASRSAPATIAPSR